MSRRNTAVAHAAPVFAALGDETRLTLVTQLGATGPQSITSLTTGSTVTRQAVSKHLDVLAEAGLVRSIKRGRERIWALETARVEDASRYLEQISKRWDDALDRLKKLVET